MRRAAAALETPMAHGLGCCISQCREKARENNFEGQLHFGFFV
jgi:hypothetical protein